MKTYNDDYDHCYECTGYGDDYYYDVEKRMSGYAPAMIVPIKEWSMMMISCGRKASHRNVVIYQKSLKRFRRKLFATCTRKRIKRPRLYWRTCLEVLQNAI